MLEAAQIALLWTLRQFWRSLPVMLTIAAILLSMMPMNLLQDFVPPPDVALIAVFFWAIHGPEFLPPWTVFLIGLVQDFAVGAPIGFWALILLVAYGFTMSQRVFFKGRTGIGVWFGFALVAIASAGVAWALGVVVFGKWFSPGQTIMQTGISVAAYPVFARLFLFVRGMLTTAPQSI